jgi:prepilin-type N-terminal cleavage/methylation domain-containing protein
VRIGIPARRGFTLIEIMIVIGIIAMVMTAGVPMMTRALSKNQLAKAVNDVLEGCKLARDRAILQNTPYDFVIRNRSENDAEILVEAAKVKDPGVTATATRPVNPMTGSAQPAVAANKGEAGSLLGDFPRKIGADVVIELIYVNMVDHMDAAEARVRFYPNGTADEFTVILAYQGKRRTIKVDIVTGAAWEVTP